MTDANHRPDRTTRAAAIPFPPMQLSRSAHTALIGLRLFICLTTAMAIFTIVHA
ncbi:MAG TPA: hypothetical protein VGN89_18370 [Phenylobacterium sp.]|nr:hypothetical protein [Phenylobacterium sp.]